MPRAWAFLLTDIEGSTARWELHGAAMGAAVARHDAILADAVGQAGGTVFKTTGDGVCAVFSATSQALAAAFAAQTALAAADFTAVDGLRVRMAVHCGPAEARDGDYFGPILNRAARLRDIGHGGQILVSQAASAEESYRFRGLGRHRLKDLAEPESVYQLLGPGLAADFPALRSLDARPHNLPFQASAFFGREAELAELRALMARCPLVTLLGPGGIGKTRLSLQAGAELLDDHPDGVWFVELAGLTRDEQVAEAVAGVFNLSLRAGAGACAQVAASLGPSRLLIILDNCEHVIAGAAEFADAMLRRSTSVSILASSRSPLGVPGEQSYEMPALGLPAAAKNLTAAEVLDYTAVQLFVDRAQRASPGFAVNDGNAPDIAAICLRLDGLALPIEMAAARVKMLAPKDLLARLNDRFRLLTGGSRTALPRQQTVRAMLDWSFNLLDEAERAALRRLSIFAGSFDLAGAEAVIAGGLVDASAVFDLVASLLDKSLIVRLPRAAGETRFRLLETTRHYALEKLAEAGESAALQRGLALYVTAVFRQSRETWPEADNEVWTAKYAPEIDNLRVVLDWAFNADGDAGIAVALAASLWGVFLSDLITTREYDSALSAGEKLLTPDMPAADEALLRHDCAARRVNGHDQEILIEKCLPVFQSAGDTEMAAVTAARIAGLYAWTGDFGAATTYIDLARTTMRTIQSCPPSQHHAMIMGLLGGALVRRRGEGDLAAARADFEHGRTIVKKLPDKGGVVAFTCHIARLDAELENYAAAITSCRPLAPAMRSERRWHKLEWVLDVLVYCHALQGDAAAAKTAARELLALRLEIWGQDLALDPSLVAASALATAQSGALAQAARLAGFVQQCDASASAPPWGVEQRLRERLAEALDAAAVTGALPEAERQRLMAEGAAMTEKAALALVQEIS